MISLLSNYKYLLLFILFLFSSCRYVEINNEISFGISKKEINQKLNNEDSTFHYTQSRLLKKDSVSFKIKYRFCSSFFGNETLEGVKIELIDGVISDNEFVNFFISKNDRKKINFVIVPNTYSDLISNNYKTLFIYTDKMIFEKGRRLIGCKNINSD